MKASRQILALILFAAISSCEELDDVIRKEEFKVDFQIMGEDGVSPDVQGVYVLNNGNWGANDANVGIYDYASKMYEPKVFRSVNEMNLGDLAQDVIEIEDRVYLAVYGSRTIFSTDRGLRLKTRINAQNGELALSPRSFATDGELLYVTYYEGYVFEIDALHQEFRAVEVGSSPEGLAVAGDCLYVANSGGALYPDYGNTVSVVSLENFAERRLIEVNPNPIKVEASSDGAYVYVSSYGDYGANPAKLQVIATSTGGVSDVAYQSVSSICSDRDVLYILCGGYDENWNPLPSTVYKHDMKTNLPLGTFVADDTVLANAYSISVARDGNIYVGCSDYVTNGDVYVFTPDGKLYDKFDSQGLNPLKVY